MNAAFSITLPENLQHWAETQASLGGFENVDEFVVQVLREERKRQAMESLELKLVDALNSGPVTPMTENDWNDLKQLARQGKAGVASHAAQH